MEKKDVCEVFYFDPEKIEKVKKEALSDETAFELAQFFQALSDTTRVKIISALAHQELCVCDLANLLGLSVSAVSHQLRMLRNLRLVKLRREGRMVYYSLDDKHVGRVFKQGLEHVIE